VCPSLIDCFRILNLSYENVNDFQFILEFLTIICEGFIEVALIKCG
jgi:hypothetical protein